MAFLKISNLVDKRIQQSGVSQEVKAARVLAMADNVLQECFGAEIICQTAKAVIFKFGCLQIATMNSSLKQEIILRKEELVAQVNQKMGNQIVKDIQVIL